MKYSFAVVCGVVPALPITLSAHPIKCRRCDSSGQTSLDLACHSCSPSQLDQGDHSAFSICDSPAAPPDLSFLLG